MERPDWDWYQPASEHVAAGELGTAEQIIAEALEAGHLWRVSLLGAPKLQPLLGRRVSRPSRPRRAGGSRREVSNPWDHLQRDVMPELRQDGWATATLWISSSDYRLCSDRPASLTPAASSEHRPLRGNKPQPLAGPDDLPGTFMNKAVMVEA